MVIGKWWAPYRELIDLFVKHNQLLWLENSPSPTRTQGACVALSAVSAQQIFMRLLFPCARIRCAEVCAFLCTRVGMCASANHSWQADQLSLITSALIPPSTPPSLSLSPSFTSGSHSHSRVQTDELQYHSSSPFTAQHTHTHTHTRTLAHTHCCTAQLSFRMRIGDQGERSKIASAVWIRTPLPDYFVRLQALLVVCSYTTVE